MQIDRERPGAAPDAQVVEDAATAQCEWCSGTGWLGGPSYYSPGEGGEECSHCQGDGWVFPSARSAQGEQA